MAHVLIVDDSIIQRGLIRNMLKVKAHDSVEVPNGDAAFSALETFDIDLIVLDLLMPGKGGLEVLREIRAKEIDVPVICTVAADQDSTRRKCRELGAQGFLTKPIDQTELLDEVERVLSTSDVEGAEQLA